LKEPSAAKISVTKKLLFSTVMLLMVAGVVEALLALLGLGVLEHADDPFVGFDSTSPLFVSTQIDGEELLATAPAKQVWFNYQQFQVPKPENTRRIFCLGGSTTFGRPFDDKTAFSGWLRQLLPLAEPQTHWEVINAGGVSYASYRVASLMEELCQYEPDLFIVLTGHNEFLERRTYAGLLEEGWSEDRFVARTRSVLQSSRLYNLIESIGRPKNEFMIQDREQLPEEVDEMLNHSAGPKDYVRDDQWHEKVLLHLRVNLVRMIQMAEKSGAQIVFVSPASNLRDCLPFKSVSNLQRQKNDMENDFGSENPGSAGQMIDRESGVLPPTRSELQQRMESEEVPALLASLNAHLEGDPRNADLLFYKGRCLYLLGREEEAREAFWMALDEDVCPLRATRKVCAAIHQVAQQYSVTCVDFDQVLGRDSMRKHGHRCFGDEYFLDHVHPSIETHGLIANEILTSLREIGWTQLREIDPSDMDDVSKRVVASVDQDRQAIAFRNLAKVLHWAGKFEEAIPQAVNATRLLPEDLESWFVMADCLRQLGRNDEAYLVYQQLFMKGDYGRAYLPFGELLMDMGRYDRAREFLLMATIVPKLEHRIRAYYDLGYSHLQLGEFKLALESLLECEKLAKDEPATVALIGEAHFAMGDYPSAEMSFKRLLEMGGEPVYAYRQLAEAKVANGRVPEAINDLSRCLELAPSDHGIRARLDELRAMGRVDSTE
jgi:tetratricopeptide (TPR) repeat protein